MAKVYRAVPILEDTILKHRKLDQRLGNMESKLYELGIVPFEEVYSFFHKTGYSSINTFSYNHERYKSFFLFPNDAFKRPFTTIERYCYDYKRWEILEYDIPEEILLNFCGYGYYSEDAIVEFAIPESAFQSLDKIDDSILNKKIDDILKQTMLEFEKQGISVDTKESFKFLDTQRNAYFSSFITGNKVIVNHEELLNKSKSDFISDEEIISLLEEKGIKCSSFLPLYYDLIKDSNSVNCYKETYVNELREKLKENLPNLFNSEKNYINK